MYKSQFSAIVPFQMNVVTHKSSAHKDYGCHFFGLFCFYKKSTAFET